MALDPEAASAILDDADDDDDDDTDPKIDEYGAAIPSQPYMLHANGDIYDLRDPDQVNDLQEQIKSDRNDLQIGELPKYEGHSTDWGGGGRARLLYDQVRVDLAQEYHEGRHHMSWTEQYQEAMKVVRIVAVKNRNMY
jgi:hypothetical protein